MNTVTSTISTPYVQIIADSEHNGIRLTTFKLRYWRPILPEMNTHRMFSRNASSSRAMTYEKLVDQVKNHTWVPEHWNAEQKGMTGGEEFDSETKWIIDTKIQNLAHVVCSYLQTIDDEVFSRTGKHIHKQYINRYLEPFRCVDQIVTSTEWNNFFKLRCAPDAQPEIKDIAETMKSLLEVHKPRHLEKGEWHLPFITDDEREHWSNEACLKVSAARCARVSYSNYDAKHTLMGDIKLADRLLENGHMSPFEHQAIPAEDWNYNLYGWQSQRFLIENEGVSPYDPEF